MMSEHGQQKPMILGSLRQWGGIERKIMALCRRVKRISVIRNLTLTPDVPQRRPPPVTHPWLQASVDTRDHRGRAAAPAEKLRHPDLGLCADPAPQKSMRAAPASAGPMERVLDHP